MHVKSTRAAARKGGTRGAESGITAVGGLRGHHIDGKETLPRSLCLRRLGVSKIERAGGRGTVSCVDRREDAAATGAVSSRPEVPEFSVWKLPCEAWAAELS